MEKSRVEVEKRRCDSRFPLSFYFRIANQIIKQARVYRDEQSITDLYCTLNRYSSLVSKILPQHPSYSTYSSKEKLRHRKILKEFSKEMETLRPRLGRNMQQLERSKSNGSGSNHAAKESKVKHSGTVDNNIQSPNISVNDVSIFRTGSIKHYFVPAEDVELSSVVMIDPSTGCAPCEPPCLISPAMANDGDVNVHIVTQSSPSPVLSFFEDAPCAARISHINSNSSSSLNESSVSTTIHNVHISARLMEDFLELAKDNTDKDLETCGVLGAFLKNGTFYVTTLIIPKQESTSSSCQALNEEEIHSIQEEQSLFPVGWIHTHPSQSCFMSSIDLHTHYSYQLMLPEAFAVVMAPTDATKNYGIFRLTDPGGTTVLRECPERGFHPHKEPPDGGPLYQECSNVYINPNLSYTLHWKTHRIRLEDLSSSALEPADPFPEAWPVVVILDACIIPLPHRPFDSLPFLVVSFHLYHVIYIILIVTVITYYILHSHITYNLLWIRTIQYINL